VEGWALRLLRNLLRLKYGGLAIFATVHEIFDHKWENGRLKCSGNCVGPRYVLVIEQHVKGRLVGRLRVETCHKHDVGM
jgi:hypothetical protein